MKLAYALVATVLSASSFGAFKFVRPDVIPEPVRLDYAADRLCRLDDAATVRVVCPDPTAADWVKAKLGDFLHVAPAVERVSSLADARGDAGLPDAYRLKADGGVFTLEAAAPAGVRNAFYTLRMCLMAERGKLTTRAWICPALDVTDRPLHAFRAMHVCWMPETATRTIERQIRLAAYFKFNYLILEFWGTYDSAAYPWFGWPDCKIPTAELKRLVALGRDLGVELVPDLNCFGHASMARGCGGKHATLDMHPEHASLFEPREGWVWCLTNPETKKVLKTLVAEMYETFGRPGYFHIGCDESHPPSCPTCAATDWPVTVAEHVREMRDYIASLGARTLMWHDMLISRKDPKWAGEAFRRYPINGSSKESCERLLGLLPKDVVICDWYYGSGEAEVRTEFPTWDYFKGLGFGVVPCSWMKPETTLAMGRAAAEKGTFGFMGTCWHHSYNPELYLIYLPSAFAAWGTADAWERHDAMDFATRWRQVGWDMGDMKSKADCGYSEDEIPRHTSTPW